MRTVTLTALTGTNGNDTLTGSAFEDQAEYIEAIRALAGDDVINVIGDSLVFAGAGDDVINVTLSGYDYAAIITGPGDDVVNLDLSDEVFVVFDDGEDPDLEGVSPAWLSTNITLDYTTYTGRIDKANGGTTRINGLDSALSAGGIMFVGTAGEDTFTVIGDTADGYVGIYTGLGNDTIDIGQDTDVSLRYFALNGVMDNIEMVADLRLGTIRVTGDLVERTWDPQTQGPTVSITTPDVSFTDRFTGHLNQLQSGHGEDTVLGSDQGETVDLGEGDGLFNGRGGVDTIRYTSSAYSDLEVNLTKGLAEGSFRKESEFEHQLRNVENIKGSRNDDDLTGNAVANRIEGNGGDDDIYGRAGADWLYGGDGNDDMEGNGGKDRIWGNAGRDYIEAGYGHDNIWGGNGSDHMEGGAGSDRLWGGIGFDTLEGGAGKDVLTGGRGNDLLTGGAGIDRFVFARNSGRDTVTDYADEDVLHIRGHQGGFATLSITESGDDLVITHDGGVIILEDQAGSTLTAADFLF